MRSRIVQNQAIEFHVTLLREVIEHVVNLPSGKLLSRMCTLKRIWNKIYILRNWQRWVVKCEILLLQLNFPLIWAIKRLQHVVVVEVVVDLNRSHFHLLSYLHPDTLFLASGTFLKYTNHVRATLDRGVGMSLQILLHEELKLVLKLLKHWGGNIVLKTFYYISYIAIIIGTIKTCVRSVIKTITLH